MTGIPPIPIIYIGEEIMKKKCENCFRTKHRTEEEKKDLNRRLKIIAGQVNGIGQIIDDDRYCDDVLLQVASNWTIY